MQELITRVFPIMTLSRGILVSCIPLLVSAQLSCGGNASSDMEIAVNGGVSPGRFNPFRLTDDPSVVKILYEIRKTPKAPLAISTRTGSDEEFVRGKLEECRELEIVREDDGEYLASFVFLDKEEKHQVRSLAEKLAVEELQIIKEALDPVRDVFESCSFERQGYDWDSMSHIIMGAHLSDMAVMERGFSKYELPGCIYAPPRPGGGRYWLNCVEGGMRKFNFANHVRGYENEGWGIWFSTRTDTRPHLTYLTQEQWTIVRHLMTRGSDTLDGLCDVSDEPCEIVEKIIKTLIKAKWISKAESGYTIAFPVFGPEDLQKMIGKLDIVGSEIVEAVYIDSQPEVKGLFKRLRPRLDEKEYGGFFGIVKTWVREICLEKLMEDGTIPKLSSDSIQQNWGWIGSFQYK